MIGEVLVIVAALLVGFLLGRFALIRRRETFRHEHIWTLTASSHLNVLPNEGAKLPMRKTRLLDVCGCGEQRVRTIDGHWEPAQLGLSA